MSERSCIFSVMVAAVVITFLGGILMPLNGVNLALMLTTLGGIVLISMAFVELKPLNNAVLSVVLCTFIGLTTTALAGILATWIYPGFGTLYAPMYMTAYTVVSIIYLIVGVTVERLTRMIPREWLWRAVA